MTRYVIRGAGAIGGIIGARLQAGHEVALIATPTTCARGAVKS